jgi:hypothetical protein
MRGVGDLSLKESTVVPESFVVVLELATTVMATTVGSDAEASVLALSIFVVFDGFPDALREGLATMMVCLASSYNMVSADLYVSLVVSFSPAVEEAFVKTDLLSPVKGMLRRGFFWAKNCCSSSSSQKMGPPTAESRASFTVPMATHQGFSGGSSLGAAELVQDSTALILE